MRIFFIKTFLLVKNFKGKKGGSNVYNQSELESDLPNYTYLGFVVFDLLHGVIEIHDRDRLRVPLHNGVV